jgi:hypothetical protein
MPRPLQARAEGDEMKNWKWPSKLGIQLCIIAVLIFVIWIVLQNPARWR